MTSAGTGSGAAVVVVVATVVVVVVLVVVVGAIVVDVATVGPWPQAAKNTAQARRRPVERRDAGGDTP